MLRGCFNNSEQEGDVREGWMELNTGKVVHFSQLDEDLYAYNPLQKVKKMVKKKKKRLESISKFCCQRITSKKAYWICPFSKIGSECYLHRHRSWYFGRPHYECKYVEFTKCFWSFKWSCTLWSDNNKRSRLVSQNMGETTPASLFLKRHWELSQSADS